MPIDNYVDGLTLMSDVVPRPFNSEETENGGMLFGLVMMAAFIWGLLTGKRIK